ncbi:SGNH/GDSL hydrolase family protein [Pseudonocardia endophytica]|uniref:SGNH/GDSL hydrolase family protein n=1 Tax=Pseudonocardia endophytica TaxID=401976 RepID=UPI001052DF37|nr:SGNH/GDSL hydrolase family protein [Pseudonocardia endophytica]
MALTLLSIATVVMLVLAIQKQASLSSGGASAAAATPPPPPPQPSVAFVADGYTSGSPSGGEGPASYTALLAAREGWRVTNPAVYGSGYVAGAPLSDQVQKVVDARPQLVVVSGGRADSGSDPDAVRDAAGRLFQDLKTRLPQAKVVVIGPMWIGGDAPRRMAEVRDAIRDTAAEARLPFVDPIEERWFNDRDQDGLTPDGENLNDRGHQRLSELVDDALRKVNVLPQ